MPGYRRFIPPFEPIGSAASATTFASPMLERLRNKQKGRRKAALEDWENEGGRMADSDVAVPVRPSINTDNRFGKLVITQLLP